MESRRPGSADDVQAEWYLLLRDFGYRLDRVHVHHAANNAIDSSTYMNYTNTRWESASSDPQWIMVDLGSAMDVNRVILKWHENAGRSFAIQVSTNGSTWEDVYNTNTGGSRTVTDVTFDRTSARYVRMNGTQRTGSRGYSLFDFMVLNDADVTTNLDYRGINASRPSLTWKDGVLSYHVSSASWTRLEAFDSRGKSVGALINGFQRPGRHEIPFPGNQAAGPYHIRLQQEGRSRATLQVFGPGN